MDIPLGPYLLHHPIGQGAMGTVWSGVHRAQQVPVAIKVLGGDGVIRPSFRKAFRTEVRAVAALDHPHVVLVHDHGEIDAETARLSSGALAEGVPWLVMEWASRGNLASNLPWGWEALRETLDTLLGALAHVHARGVVHRDLKPANVLVCGPEDARPGLKLADFGIVRLQDDPDTDHIAGTPTYMAPEQAVRGGRIGPWTDLYALGGVAWELATGKTPFDDLDPRATLRAHRWTQPPAFAPRFPVPAGLEGWLRRLLAKPPESRFPLAADAAWALSRLGPASAPSLSSSSTSRSTIPTWATTHDTVSDVPTEATDTEEVSRSQEPAVAEAPVEVPPIPAAWAVDTTRGALLRGAGLGLYGLRAIPMVDREAEREALWSALRAVSSDGKPRAVVIAGPAGCGKSRLAEWLCERAHEVGAASSVRAVHAARPGPQDGVPGLIARHLGLGSAPDRVEERLDAWLGPSADPFLSAGVRSLLGRGDADHLGPRDRHRVVRRVLERATRDRPLVVWLDDVQWGQDALDLARYLLDDGPRPPLLLVLTAREEALAERPVEAAALAALRAERLEVGPLAPEHRRKLVQDLLGLEGAVAATVEERTAGNPLFAVQLVGDWVERGLLELGPRGFRLREGASVALPDGLHTMWADRIDRLCSTRDPADVLALEVAAVLGQEVDPDEWAAACAREGLTASQELVDVLLAQRLAREEGGRWAFVHGMLRESLERIAAEEGRIATHHLACAAALEALGSDVYTGSGARGLARERLGRHLLAGGRPDQAWSPLLDGAAIRHDRGEVDAGLLVLAEAEQALSGAPEADPRWGHVWAQRGALLTRRGAVAEAEAEYQRVLFEAEGPEWEVLAARAQTHLGIAARLRSDLKASAEMLAQAEARATAAGDAKIACLARLARAATAQAAGRREEALALATAALEEAEAKGWWEAHTQAMYWLGVTALQAGKLEDAQGWLIRVREASERVGYRPAVLECCTVLGDIARHRGDLELAELHYREARAHAVAMDASGLAVVELNLGLVLVERGRHAEAVAPLRSCAVAFREGGRKAFAGATGLLLAACAAAAGDADAWDAVATEAITTIRASGIVYTDVARCAELAGEAADLAGWPERASPAWDLAGDQWSSLGRRRELG